MDFTLISSQSDTQQGEPLGGVLFTLTHFCIFRPIATTHLTCVFPLLVSDMHIICPTLDVLPIFYDCKKSLEH